MTIGSEFRTGQTAPVSGVYAYVRHADNLSCTITPAQKEIPLSRGETFPPISGCRHAAYWRLVRYA
jgi:hypothetical protein